MFHGHEAGHPSRIGPYEVLHRLGMGETSEVLLARFHGPHGFNREVVIKRLLPRWAQDPEYVRMLTREAIAYSRLTHPATVRLYDFVQTGGELAMVLEYVNGVSLSRLRGLLRARRIELSDEAALYIGYRVFAALAAAHAARDPITGEFSPMVHRDVSPGNVLIPWDGYVKLADFGMAKISGRSSDTRAGLMKGTYGYMAPEQVIGDPISVRTDVYAGCVLLRELVARRPTFALGQPELELLTSMAHPAIAPLDVVRPDAPPALCNALRRGLSVDPEQRTVTASEMTLLLKGLIDLERARASLAATVGIVRDDAAVRARRTPSTPPPATTTAGSSEPPNVLTRDLPPPRPPTASFLAREETRLRARRAIGVGALVSVLGIAAGAVIVARFTSPAKATAAGASIASAPATPQRPPEEVTFPRVKHLIEPPEEQTYAHPLPPAKGRLATPAAESTHRVFLDGRFVGQSGITLTLTCGPHEVRIGSQGKLRLVDVPCGGIARIE